MAKFGINQRSFRYGILQKELWGRGDLPQYRDGLRDANNYLVNRQGALEPRKRLKRVAAFNGPVKLIPYLTGNNQGGLLALVATGIAHASSVQLHRIIPERPAIAPIATVYQRRALEQIKFEQFGGGIILCHQDYVPQQIILNPLSINVVNLEGFATPIEDLQYNPQEANPLIEAIYAITPVNSLGIEGPQSRIRVLHNVEEDPVNYPDITWAAIAEADSYRVYRTSVGLIGTIGLADPVGLFEEVVEPQVKVAVRNVAFAITPALITNPFAKGAVERISEISSGRGIPASQRDSIRLLRVTPNNGEQPDLLNTIVPAQFTSIQIIDQTVDRDATPPEHSFTVTADLPSNWSIYSRWYGILRQGNNELFQLFTTDVPRDTLGDSHLVNVPSNFKLRFPFSSLALGSQQTYNIDLFHNFAGSTQATVRATRAFTTLDESRAIPPTLAGVSISNFNNTTPTQVRQVNSNTIPPVGSGPKYSYSFGSDGTLYFFRSATLARGNVSVYSINKTTGAATLVTTLAMTAAEGTAANNGYAFIHPTTNEFVVLYDSVTGSGSSARATITAAVFNSTGTRTNTYTLIINRHFNVLNVINYATPVNNEVLINVGNALGGAYSIYSWPYKGGAAGIIANQAARGGNFLTDYIPAANIYVSGGQFLQPDVSLTNYNVLSGINIGNYLVRDPTTGDLYNLAYFNTNREGNTSRMSVGSPEKSSFRINITLPATGYNAGTDTVVLEIWTGVNGSGRQLYRATGVTALATTVSFLYKLAPNATFYVRGKVQRAAAEADSGWRESSFRVPG